MFGSRFRKSKNDAVTGFLGSQTEFAGKLCFSGVVHLDGRFEGEIISRGTLVVGSESVVRADIQSKVLKIAGEVHGDLHAVEKIELYPPAKVYGNILTPSLVMEEGAIFEGNCKMTRVTENIPDLALEPEHRASDTDEPLEAISAQAWNYSFEPETDEADTMERPEEETDEPRLPKMD